MRVVAFTGPSNSGKTTLISKLIDQLKDTMSISAIKHDPKDKARFDVEGKDSKIFFDSGAEVAVLSEQRTTIFSHKKSSIIQIAGFMGPCDMLFVEGLKDLPFVRIGIFRGSIDESYLKCVDAIAVDDSVDISSIKLDSEIDILDLNNTTAIAEWIDKNAKELPNA